MPPTADPNELASRALEAVGAQRAMPGLTARHGWSLMERLFGEGHRLGGALLLALLLACLGVVGVSVYRARARRSAPWQAEVAVTAGPGGAASPHLERAEAFAREGRFAEAIHELLLQALADIRFLAGAALAPSLTSREILRDAKLADGPRDALRVLIGRVEWTYFGLRAAEGSDYQACRADLDRLRQALRPA